MDKYDFIQNILGNPKLTPAQRERVLSLTKEEIKKDGIIGKDIEERVKKLEQKINENIVATKIETNENKAEVPLILEKDITYIPPNNLVKFLKDYNQNLILKTTCHDIDSNELENILTFCKTESYDFNLHRRKIQEEYKSKFFESKEYFVDHKIKNLILAYLTGSTTNKKNTPWTDEKIKINWNSEELENWCNNNEACVPNPNEGLRKIQHNKEFKFEKPISSNLIKKKNIQYFSDLVIHFKYLFHIRSDNSLYDIINHKNSINNWGNKIDFKLDLSSFPKNIELFTNVEKLIQAYKIFIELILEVVEKNNSAKPIVEISLKESKDKIELSIHHKNGTFAKTLKNTLNRNGSTFQNLIKNQLNGMCDFYLSAKFENDGCHKINIWNGKAKTSISLDNFEGVEYLLKFSL